MLKGYIKHRPKRVLAVYVEPGQIEVMHAHRKWRKWELESAERFAVPEGENLHDYLLRLNLRPRSKHGTALVLFLARSYYSFHREHYPLALQDRLEEALTFDWQENVFYEHEQTLHFSGAPVMLNQLMSVPIFSLQRDIFEKFHQALGASDFQTFAVIPSALNYTAFFASLPSWDKGLSLEVMGRLIDPSHMEVNRFYNGQLLDSLVLSKDQDNLRLFRESLVCMENGACPGGSDVCLILAEGDSPSESVDEWREQDLPVSPQDLGDSLVSTWMKYLLNLDQAQTFETPLYLKAWQVPRIVWPLLLAVVFYSLFAAYQVHSFSKLKETSRVVKKQNSQFEAQWKPIEELQTRIAKFQEDQKTLSEFSLEGYPLLEILTVLSQATPMDTWLNYLSVRKGQLVLRGESKSAIKYLPELSKMDGFTDVRFASPVTKNPASDQERFNVQIQLDLEKFKKTVEAMVTEKAEDKADDKVEPETPEEPPPPVQPPAVSSPQQVPGRLAAPPNPETEEDDDSEDPSQDDGEEDESEEDNSGNAQGGE